MLCALPGAASVLRPRWGATLPKPLVCHRLQNTRKRLPIPCDLIYPIRKEGRVIAICHIPIKIIQRSKGKSAVAAAAYRSGTKLTNEWDGLTHDYTHKGGVVHAEIMLPVHAPPEFADRSILWNSVEQIEKARDSQLAREVEVALPRELTREQQLALVRAYVKDNFVDAGMCAGLCTP